MSVFTKLGQLIAAPVDENGNARSISPQDFQVWMTEVERFLVGLGLGNLDPEDLPAYWAYATDAGAGTPNAIQATSPFPITEAVLVIMNVATTNGPGPTTVQFNGAGPVYTIKTNSGNDPVEGGLPEGMLVMGRVSGSTFRLVSDQASAAVLAQIEALVADAASDADRAEAAASVASGALTTVIDPQFSTKGTAEAFSPVIAPDYIRTAGYFMAGDGGGTLYKKVSSEPSHDGKLFITLSDGATVVWYEIAEIRLTPQMFGARGDGITDDTAAVASAIASGAKEIYFPSGSYLIGEQAVSATGGITLRGDGLHSKIVHRIETAPLFNLSAAGGLVRVEALCIDGQRTQQATNSTNRLIYCLNNPGAVRVEIVGCYFLNVAHAAIYTFGDGLSPRDSVFVSQCTFSNINEGDDAQYNPAFIFFGDGADIQVAECTFDSGYAFTSYGAQAISLASRLSGNAPQYTRVMITNNRVTGLGRMNAYNDLGAIEFYIWGENVIIEGNDLKDLFSHGIRGKSNSYNVSIVGNTILTANGEGIVVNAGTFGAPLGRHVIANNTVADTKYSGISHRGNSTFGAHNTVVIAGNTVQSVSEKDGIANGVWAEHVADLIVSNNIVRTAKRGIYVNQGKAVNLNGNIVQSVAAEGIFNENCEDLLIKGNHLNVFNNIGIFSNSCRDVVYLGNYARGNANTGATNRDYRISNSSAALVTDNFSRNAGQEWSTTGVTSLIVRNNQWQP